MAARTFLDSPWKVILVISSTEASKIHIIKGIPKTSRVKMTPLYYILKTNVSMANILSNQKFTRLSS